LRNLDAEIILGILRGIIKVGSTHEGIQLAEERDS
jgi:hypothetical protein